MPGIPQIPPMLNDRLERLRLIMVYIHDNDLMPKVCLLSRAIVPVNIHPHWGRG